MGRCCSRVSADYYKTKHGSLVRARKRLDDRPTTSHDPVQPAQPAGQPFGGRLPEMRTAKHMVANQVLALI